MTLHIYSQNGISEPAFICGTLDSLIKLKNAVEEAIANPTDVSFVEDFMHFKKRDERFKCYIMVTSQKEINDMESPSLIYDETNDSESLYYGPWTIVASLGKLSSS